MNGPQMRVGDTERQKGMRRIRRRGRLRPGGSGGRGGFGLSYAPCSFEYVSRVHLAAAGSDSRVFFRRGRYSTPRDKASFRARRPKELRELVQMGETTQRASYFAREQKRRNQKWTQGSAANATTPSSSEDTLGHELRSLPNAQNSARSQ